MIKHPAWCPVLCGSTSNFCRTSLLKIKALVLHIDIYSKFTLTETVSLYCWAFKSRLSGMPLSIRLLLWPLVACSHLSSLCGALGGGAFFPPPLLCLCCHPAVKGRESELLFVWRVTSCLKSKLTIDCFTGIKQNMPGLDGHDSLQDWFELTSLYTFKCSQWKLHFREETLV